MVWGGYWDRANDAAAFLGSEGVFRMGIGSGVSEVAFNPQADFLTVGDGFGAAGGALRTAGAGGVGLWWSGGGVDGCAKPSTAASDAGGGGLGRFTSTCVRTSASAMGS